jgi:branched-chain amino acid transport system substrate-binding protein
VTATTVKVGFEADLTGGGGAQYGDSAGAFQGRIAEQNAQGGVNGRMIKVAVADTGSTPSGAETAAKDLVQVQGVFEIAEQSNLLEGTAPFLQKAGIPVLGSGVDGPEWNEQPYTNMFNFWQQSNSNPPAAYNTLGIFFKSLGVKNVSFATVNVPSAIQAQNASIAGLTSVGISTCDDYVFPYGVVDFTAYALSFKKSGCQSVECICLLPSFLAMATDLHQAGVNVPTYSVSAPSSAILANKADIAAAEGTYFLPEYAAAGGPALVAGLEKWDPSYKGGNFPDEGAFFGWAAANAVIESLQVAGQNPTRQSVITNLRQVTSWTDEGMANPPLNFSTFGQAGPTSCQTFIQFKNGTFTPYPASGAPICGTKITK